MNSDTFCKPEIYVKPDPLTDEKVILTFFVNATNGGPSEKLPHLTTIRVLIVHPSGLRIGDVDERHQNWRRVSCRDPLGACLAFF